MTLGSRLGTFAQRVATEFKTIRSVDLGGLKNVRLTKAQYYAIGSANRDPNTRYIITDWNATDGTAGAPVTPTVKSIVGFSTVPAIGFYATISGVTGYGYNGQASGRLNAHPFWVGPVGWTADAFRTRINQARVGGTGIRRFALVPDINGYPDTTPANRLGYAVVNDLTSTGSNGGDFAFANGAVFLPPGLYWMLSVYYISAGTVTTAPTMLSITSSAFGLPTDPYNGPDAMTKGLFVDGVTDLPTTQLAITAFGANKGNDTPGLLLRRSA